MTQQPLVLITQEWFQNRPGRHLDLLRNAGFEIRYPRNPLLARGNLSERETIEELRGVNSPARKVGSQSI